MISKQKADDATSNTSSSNFESDFQDFLETSKCVTDALKNANFDLLIDYSDLGLDSFVSDSILREIPIVKTVVGLTKSGLKIKEVFFAKKLLTFLKEFHSNKLPNDKMVDFKIKFEDDRRYRENVIERVMIFNERFTEVRKSKIYANLFLTHLNGLFGWEEFCGLSSCLDNLNIITIEFLQELVVENKTRTYNGMQKFDGKISLLASAGLVQQLANQVQVTYYGKIIYYNGILGDIKYKPDVETKGNLNL